MSVYTVILEHGSTMKKPESCNMRAMLKEKS